MSSTEAAGAGQVKPIKDEGPSYLKMSSDALSLVLSFCKVQDLFPFFGVCQLWASLSTENKIYFSFLKSNFKYNNPFSDKEMSQAPKVCLERLCHIEKSCKEGKRWSGEANYTDSYDLLIGSVRLEKKDEEILSTSSSLLNLHGVEDEKQSNTKLAATGFDGVLHVMWIASESKDLKNQLTYGSSPLESGPIDAVSISRKSDGMIVTGARNGTVAIHRTTAVNSDLGNPSLNINTIQNFDGVHDSRVQSVCFGGTNDHQIVSCNSKANFVKLWDIDTGLHENILFQNFQSPIRVSYRCDDPFSLVTGFLSGKIVNIDLRANTSRAQTHLPNSSDLFSSWDLTTMSCCNSKYLFASFGDSTLRVFDWTAMKWFPKIDTDHYGPICSLYSWNNRILTGGSKDNVIGIHEYDPKVLALKDFSEDNIVTSRLSSLVGGHQDYVSGLFCQWNRVFSCSLDGTLKMWSLE